MPIESAIYLDDLDPTLPSRSDWMSEGDDHLRLIKQAIQATLRNATAPLDLDFVAKSLPPIGAIMMYAFEEAPDGWAICDGSTHIRSDGAGDIVVPDLRDKFIAASGTSYALGDSVGANTKIATTTTDGAHGHTGAAAAAGTHSHSGVTGSTALSVAQLPAHNHGGGTHTHDTTVYKYGGADKKYDDGEVPVGYTKVVPEVQTSGAATGVVATQGSNQGHSHLIPTEGSHAHGVTVDVRPLTYVLTFICKI
jgi:microcystin-dependent protein